MRKNNLKILLIAPRNIPTDKAQYSYTFPLGIAYISAVLKKANMDVSYLNLNHYNGQIREIVKAELDNQNYDVVATGHIGMGYLVVEDIFKATKKHKSNPKTILGGAIITSEPNLMFESLKPDFGVIGEGEDTILELLDAIEKKKDLKKVNGIMYRDDNQNIITTSPRQPIENLDKIPFPDFEGFDFEEKLNHQRTNLDFFTNFLDYPRPYPILASRSCIFHCTFCYREGKYRERSIKNVIEEIKFAVEKYKINIIQLYDDLFSFKKERIYEFCREIKKISEKTNQKLMWYAQLTVMNVDKELLKTMKDAGCVLVSYGFESYSEEVLKSMRKPITPQQIDSALKMTLEVKMAISACFIFGDVAETVQTAQTTIRYWRENSRGQILLQFIQPYPGSAIYKHCVEKGIIKNKLDFIKNKMPNRDFINMTDNMTDKEFLKLADAIANLMASNTNMAKLIYLKKIRKKIYEIKTKCPFCNEETVYKNYYLSKRHLYRDSLLCRHCNMRNFFVSPLFKIFIKLDLIRLVAQIYHKLVKREKRILWKE